MRVSPIVLFVYNRPWHTQRTVEALQRNHLADISELFIYSDSSADNSVNYDVSEVRTYIKSIKGFKKVTIIQRDKNWGLARSIIDGVNTIIHEYGEAIVLEDDMVTSRYFLTYMNDALQRYYDDDSVISIHGYVYPTSNTLPDAFFLRGADCWGWATWQRGWALFNSDGRALLDELKQRNLTRLFDFNDTYPYTKMLKEQINGANNSWAIRWYASAFLADKLTLYPGRSLVNNIGNDNSGYHCGNAHDLDVELSQKPVVLSDVKVEPSSEARRAFEKFFIQRKKPWVYLLLDNAFKFFKGGCK